MPYWYARSTLQKNLFITSQIVSVFLLSNFERRLLNTTFISLMLRLLNCGSLNNVKFLTFLFGGKGLKSRAKLLLFNWTNKSQTIRSTRVLKKSPRSFNSNPFFIWNLLFKSSKIITIKDSSTTIDSDCYHRIMKRN